MTKLQEDQEEFSDIIGDLEAIQRDTLPVPPLKIPERDINEILIFWENMERHYVRWLATGKRYTAKDDYEKFKTKLMELLQTYG